MRALHIYVETSVFGFALDRSEVNRLKREATIRLFEQVEDGRLVGYVSVPVIAELLETIDEKVRGSLLEMARQLTLLPDPHPSELAGCHRIHPARSRSLADGYQRLILT